MNFRNHDHERVNAPSQNSKNYFAHSRDNLRERDRDERSNFTDTRKTQNQNSYPDQTRTKNHYDDQVRRKTHLNSSRSDEKEIGFQRV